MSYFYGARVLNEVFYLEDFLVIEKEYPNFSFHLTLNRPDQFVSRSEFTQR